MSASTTPEWARSINLARINAHTGLYLNKNILSTKITEKIEENLLFSTVTQDVVFIILTDTILSKAAILYLKLYYNINKELV